MIDIDEADVTVLNQNLFKSQELFLKIQTSLSNILDKSLRALTKIKPILKDVNQLTKEQKEINNGIGMLEDVSEICNRCSEYEGVLNQSIDLIGVPKFVLSLTKSKGVLHEFKQYKKFKGVFINFATLIDRLELSLQNNLQKLSHRENTLDSTNDIKITLNYFKENDYVQKTFLRHRGEVLVQKFISQPIKFDLNAPIYERGSNGLTELTDYLLLHYEIEKQLLLELDIYTEQRLTEIFSHVFNENLSGFIKVFEDEPQDPILLFELLDNLLRLGEVFEFNKFPVFNANWTRLISSTSTAFFNTTFIRIERKVVITKNPDLQIPELIIEWISKLRKWSEFDKCMLLLMANPKIKLGTWLESSPSLRFLSTYTSVLPEYINDNELIKEPAYLISSFYSDVIDCLFVNVEIEMKKKENILAGQLTPASSTTSLGIGGDIQKKSTQGFLIIKNLIMVETIINRSAKLYEALGKWGQERIRKLKNRYLKMFLDDWNYASYIIIRDMTQISTIQATQHLSNANKEKELIKELFKNFNDAFEEALRNYQRFNITDVNLRNLLAGEIKKLILNAYFKLYDKYGSGEWTKNRAKYIKWDKKSFEQTLNEKLG